MRATKAEEWRADESPFDTAPPTTPPTLDPSTWGVTAEEGRALLRRQMCPVCGAGPFKSPLIHTGKAHGLARFDVRDALGLTTTESLVDDELRGRLRENGRGRDMSTVNHPGKPRRKYRHTTAGRAALTSNLETVTPEQSRASLELAHTPDAQAKRSATLRAKWEAATIEERAQWGARVGGDQEHMDMMRRARWETQPLQPCGTVAAYKRGCRCEPCRDAKRESRKRDAQG